MGAHQPKNQAESMDYEESGPKICTPLVQATIPRIRYFLQQRLHIDE
jgi:hypothetical protein